MRSFSRSVSEAREELKKKRGVEYSYPVLAFHGTAMANIQPICETGFKVPGKTKAKEKNHRDDLRIFLQDKKVSNTRRTLVITDGELTSAYVSMNHYFQRKERVRLSFQEYPGYSMGYIKGSSKLLLCQVLQGKVSKDRLELP